MPKRAPDPSWNFRPGDLVEIRSAAEIARTLDAKGRLDGLPFMPEMIEHCGRRYRVHHNAVRVCVEGLGLRRIDDAILLDGVRCHGTDHDGCERNCLLFWRSAWLKPVPAGDTATPSAPALGLEGASLLADLPTLEGDRFVCQSTALATVTRDLSPWQLPDYWAEIRRGGLTFTEFFLIAAYIARDLARRAVGLPAVGQMSGPQSRKSKGNLSLKGGELVRVRSEAEIKSTLDPNGRNLGLSFDPVMTGLVGQSFEVASPIRRIILEESGKMVELSSTVALKDVYCKGICTKSCPRLNPIYWREAWLEPVDPRRTAPAPLPPPGDKADPALIGSDRKS